MTRPREGPDARSMSPSEAAAKKIADNTIEILRAERDRLFNTVAQQAAEIERLRAFEMAARDLNNDLTRIAKERDEMATQIKKLKEDLEQAEIRIRARLDVIDQQAARIKVLEQAFLQNAYERNKVSHGHSWYPDDETYEDYLNRVDVDAHAEAQRSLDAILVNARPPGVDGKISIGDHIVGPDQMVPCWQITEERKKTLIDSIELIELNNYYNDHTMFNLCNMLRAMLTEAGQ